MPNILFLLDSQSTYPNIVLEEELKFVYIKKGNILIGSDESNTFVRVFHQKRHKEDCPDHIGEYATLTLSTGHVKEYYGNWRTGTYATVETILGREIKEIRTRHLNALDEEYKFKRTAVFADKLDALYASYKGELYDHNYFRTNFWLGEKEEYTLRKVAYDPTFVPKRERNPNFNKEAVVCQ